MDFEADAAIIAAKLEYFAHGDLNCDELEKATHRAIADALRRAYEAGGENDRRTFAMQVLGYTSDANKMRETIADMRLEIIRLKQQLAPPATQEGA